MGLLNRRGSIAMSKLQNTTWAHAAVQYVKTPRAYNGKPERTILAFNNGEFNQIEDDKTAEEYQQGFIQMMKEAKVAIEELMNHTGHYEGKDKELDGKREIKIHARFALERGFGNCTHQAALAFRYLKKTCQAPRVDIMFAAYRAKYNDDSHVFVVIGRVDESLSRQPETWGDEAVICDPWAPVGLQVYDATELPDKMRQVLGNFTLGGSGARIGEDGRPKW
jgi:hypothetical protein